MSRAVAISVVVAFLLVGCVSLGPAQTTLPSLVPSFSITTPVPSASATPSITFAPTASPAATAPPTQAATATPTEAPTAAPSASPEPSLTPAPSAAVIEDFGAEDLLFEDDFSDPTSGWGVASTAGGEIAYVDSVLQFDTVSERSWMWSTRTDPLSWPVVHVEADITPSADGFVGLLCARSSAEVWGAAANADGVWAFLKIGGEVTTLLESNEGIAGAVVPGATTRMALDCAGTDTGSFRMQLSLPDLGLAAEYEGSGGPDRFDRVGVYTQSLAHPYSLRVDNLVAYGGEGLLLRVPTAWRAGCIETAPSASDTGAQAALSCPVTTGRSDVVDYVLFNTDENMQAAYQARVDNWAVEPTASCQSGPNEGNYTIAGVTAGRILCAPQISGIRFDWTHDSLLILSTLTNFGGSYPDTYQDWLIAGPE